MVTALLGLAALSRNRTSACSTTTHLIQAVTLIFRQLVTELQKGGEVKRDRNGARIEQNVDASFHKTRTTHSKPSLQLVLSILQFFLSALDAELLLLSALGFAIFFGNA